MCESQDYFALSQIISVVLFTQSTIYNLSNIIILSGVPFLERNQWLLLSNPLRKSGKNNLLLSKWFFQIQSKTDKILLTCKIFRSFYLFRLNGTWSRYA